MERNHVNYLEKKCSEQSRVFARVYVSTSFGFDAIEGKAVIKPQMKLIWKKEWIEYSSVVQSATKQPNMLTAIIYGLIDVRTYLTIHQLKMKAYVLMEKNINKLNNHD